MEKFNSKKTIAILISGKAGVGKSLSASLLENYVLERHGARTGTFHFAQAVKSTAKQMGWDGNKDPKGRALLQGIGQVGRAYDKDIWVDKTINGEIEGYYLYPLDVVFIDDWRFPNEAEFIKKSPLYEIVKLRLEAPDREILKGTPEYDEISENSLPAAPYGLKYYDYVIVNNGSVKELEERLKQFWEFVLTEKGEFIKWKH